jgi:hypothetical protein
VVSGKQTLEEGILQRRMRENSGNFRKKKPYEYPSLPISAPSSYSFPATKTGARLACERWYLQSRGKGKAAV